MQVITRTSNLRSIPHTVVDVDMARRRTRRWRLFQARAALRRARWWLRHFGDEFFHELALKWHLEELKTADRYRKWAHTRPS